MIMRRHFNIYFIVGLITVSVILISSIDVGAYETKSNRQNRVRVDVRPVQLTPGQPARFEIRMNTHSGNLGQDMIAVCTLKDNRGCEYQPTNWEGSPPSGHHRRGVLEFPALNGASESITLVIRDIANVPERIFEWSIKN
jgi:hypothetical protein